MFVLTGKERGDFRVVFPSWQESGAFEVELYSTSEVKDFGIQRSDGKDHDQQVLIERGETDGMLSRYKPALSSFRVSWKTWDEAHQTMSLATVAVYVKMGMLCSYKSSLVPTL